MNKILGVLLFLFSLNSFAANPPPGATYYEYGNGVDSYWDCHPTDTCNYSPYAGDLTECAKSSSPTLYPQHWANLARDCINVSFFSGPNATQVPPSWYNPYDPNWQSTPPATPTPTPIPTPTPTPIPTPTPFPTPAFNSDLTGSDLSNASTSDGVALTKDGKPLYSCSKTQVACVDPINMGTGSFWHDEVDFKVNGRTEDTGLEMKRTYTARPVVAGGDFGPNWFSKYETRLIPGSSSANPDMVWLDERGGAWTFAYSASGYISPSGMKAKLIANISNFQLKLNEGLTYTFNKASTSIPFGALTSITERHGETLTVTYDSNGRVATVSSPFAGSIQFNRNPSNLVTSVVRLRDSLTYTYTYNSSGELESVTDFNSRTTSYQYSSIGSLPDHFLTSITDPLNRTMTNTYDSHGRVTRQNDKGGGFTTFVYSEGSAPYLHRTDVRQINGASVSYFFDESYRTTKYQDPDGYTQLYTWDSNDHMITKTDEKWKVTTYGYDADGNVTSILKPGDTVATTFTYAAGTSFKTLETPILDAPTVYTLDDFYDVEKVSRTANFQTLFESYDRDNFGNITTTSTVEDAYSDQYNSNGFKTYVYDLHNPETRTYDTRGRVATRTFGSGRVLTMTYNNDDQVTIITDNSGPTQNFTYDTIGRLTQKSVTDGTSSQNTHFTYDAHDRILTETDALGRTTTYVYDVSPIFGDIKVFQKPLKITDANGHETNFEYDNFERLTKKTDANGNYTNYTYDPRGDLTSVSDPLSHDVIHYYWYDDKRNLSYESEFNPRRIGNSASTIWEYTYYTYDAQNRVTKKKVETPTDPNFARSVTDFTYNSFGRLSNKELYHEDGSGNQDYDDEIYLSYESALRTQIHGVGNSERDLVFTHETKPPFNLIRSITDTEQFSDLFNVTYDSSGNINQVYSSSGPVVYEQTNDAAGRMTSVSSGDYNGATSGALTATMGYDSFGRKSTLSSTTNVGSYTAVYGYDLNNRAISLTWTPSVMPLLPYSESISYDYVGNVSSRTRGTSVETFGYDNRNQLTSVSTQVGSASPTVQNFVYDANGNRTSYGSNSSTFVNNFQVSGYQTGYFASADGQGFLDQEIDTSSSTSSTYTYRADGKLKSLCRDSGMCVFYSYDGLGRRTNKDIYDASSTFIGTQSDVYLGTDDRVMLSKDVNSNITVYIDGQGTDEHLGYVTTSSAKSFVTDYLGSVLNNAPAGTQHSFGAFGETSASRFVLNTTSDPINYGFAGLTYDSESGLYYMRARMYDPNQGRFTSRDPIGFSAGDDNLYRYVGNNPLSAIDPSGLDVIDLTSGKKTKNVSNQASYQNAKNDRDATVVVIDQTNMTNPNDGHTKLDGLTHTDDPKTKQILVSVDPTAINPFGTMTHEFTHVEQIRSGNFVGKTYNENEAEALLSEFFNPGKCP